MTLTNKIAMVAVASFLCLAPTCKTPTASGELTSYFQTDSNIVITGNLQLDADVKLSEETQKLLNGEWAKFGGIEIQVPHDSTLKANIRVDIKTK